MLLHADSKDACHTMVWVIKVFPVCMSYCRFWYAMAQNTNEPQHDKTNIRPVCLLIRIFAVCMKNTWVLGYHLTTDSQADLSLR